MKSFLVFLSIIQVDPFHVGEDDEKIDLDLAGDKAGGIVFIDNGLDALEDAVSVDDNRNAPSSGSDDDFSRADEIANDSFRDDIYRLRGGHDFSVASSGILMRARLR